MVRFNSTSDVVRGSGMTRLRMYLALALVAATSSPASSAAVEKDSGARIIAADAEPQNWLSTGRNYQETRYSPLDQINTGNVADLKLAWFYDLDTHLGQE